MPGEFSFRAVRNNKMSLEKAGAIFDLINAKNSIAAELAFDKIDGAQHKVFDELKNNLHEVVTLSELGIDFSDQDLDEVSLKTLKKKNLIIINKLKYLKNTFSKGKLLQEGVPVALVGLANVGKSTFFNSLLGQERSIVSNVAGTTRDVVSEVVTLEKSKKGKTTSISLRLEDTAGLREAKNKIEKLGINLTKKSAERAELILFLVDATNPDLKKVKHEWKRIGEPTSKTIGILTKSKLSSIKKNRSIINQLKKIGIQKWIETSVLENAGVDKAIYETIAFSEKRLRRKENEIFLTQEIQLEAIEKTLVCLERANTTKQNDLFATDLRQGLHFFGPLIGETLTEDILKKIFSNYCIGK